MASAIPRDINLDIKPQEFKELESFVDEPPVFDGTHSSITQLYTRNTHTRNTHTRNTHTQHAHAASHPRITDHATRNTQHATRNTQHVRTFHSTTPHIPLPKILQNCATEATTLPGTIPAHLQVAPKEVSAYPFPYTAGYATSYTTYPYSTVGR
jgi:hypothetical protein